MSVLNTLRQEVFSRLVSEGRSYTEAAIAAGYSKRSAASLGSQLMRQRPIRERVLQLKAAKQPVLITRETVLEHLTGPDQATGRAMALRDETGVVLGFYIPVTTCSPVRG